MTYAELISAVRYRWKGISTTDPDDDALKALVHHGLCSIKTHCPMAFLDDRGRLMSIPNETDFIKDWNDNVDNDVPLSPEFYEAIIVFCLWKLYLRDQNDVRDQSVTSMMRRDYLAALGMEG